MEKLSTVRSLDFKTVLYPIDKHLDIENGLLELDGYLQHILRESDKDIAFRNGNIIVVLSQKSTLHHAFNTKKLRIYYVTENHETGNSINDVDFSDEFRIKLNSNTEKIFFAHLIL